MHEPLHLYLKRLREARGAAWSQTRLGKCAGVSHTTISRIELGKLKPSQPMLAKLAPCLGVEIADLWRRAGYATGGLPDADTEGTPANLMYKAMVAMGLKDDVRAVIMRLVESEVPQVAEQRRELAGCAGGQ